MTPKIGAYPFSTIAGPVWESLGNIPQPPVKDKADFSGVKRPCRAAGVRYNERMKTLTITEGRGRLGYWLKKATQGEDVGFVFEGKIVALRPVEVVSTDYALQEYGLTPAEMKAAEKRISADLKAARARGELTRFTGSKDDFR
jgi:hypothetical protein